MYSQPKSWYEIKPPMSQIEWWHSVQLRDLVAGVWDPPGTINSVKGWWAVSCSSMHDTLERILSDRHKVGQPLGPWPARQRHNCIPLSFTDTHTHTHTLTLSLSLSLRGLLSFKSSTISLSLSLLEDFSASSLQQSLSLSQPHTRDFSAFSTYSLSLSFSLSLTHSHIHTHTHTHTHTHIQDRPFWSGYKAQDSGLRKIKTHCLGDSYLNIDIKNSNIFDGTWCHHENYLC